MHIYADILNLKISKLIKIIEGENLMNKAYIKLLKKNLEDNNYEESIENLLKIYKEDRINFRKKILFSEILCAPTKIVGYDDTNNEKMKKILCKMIELGTEHKFSEEIMDFSHLLSELYDIEKTISIIRNNYKNNLKVIKANEFYNYSIHKQLILLCYIFETQINIAEEKLQEIFEEKTATGYEGQLDILKTKEGIIKSLEGSVELYVEILDNVIEYLYRLAGNKIESFDDNALNDINSYSEEELEKYLKLISGQNFLQNIWERFKYEDFLLESKIDEDKYVFKPKDINAFFIERIAIERAIAFEANLINSISMEKREEIIHSHEEIKKFIIKMNTFSDIFKMDENDYLQINMFDKMMVETLKENIIDESYYHIVSNTNSKIEMQDVFDVIIYLKTIARVFHEFKNLQSKNDILDMIAILRLEDIINHYARINKNCNIAVARDLIDIFVYKASEKILNNQNGNNKNKNLDLFCTPLIYFGQGKILFSNIFIRQINVSRVVEEIKIKWGKNIAEKGFKFNEDLINLLSLSDHIKVNKKEVKFIANDGKEIEFDFIATFEDYLLLIEIKNFETPYSVYERHKLRKDVKGCSKQVLRRINSVQNEEDWGKIRKQCNIKLPKMPFKKDKIIYLNCLSVLDFTSMIINDVRVIDSKCLLEFFLKPYVEVKIFNSISKVVTREKIIKSEKVTVKDFLKYIRFPKIIEEYKNCLSYGYKKVPKFHKSDKNIEFYDLYMTKSPVHAIYKNSSVRKIINENIKFERNELCKCGSGKKYKRCCGK